jgi:GH25 family lysozyme M1 (1,4-beta-N-acetylmuramidase)
VPILKKAPSKRTPAKKKAGAAKKKGQLRLIDGAVILALVAIVVCAVVLPKLRTAVDITDDADLISSQVQMLVQPYCPYNESGYIDNADGTISYEDSLYTSVAGIDVSSHQGEIDWEAVAQDGISFAIVRLGARGYTAGELSKDEMAMTNLTSARENGLLVGAYVYSQAITPEEAQEEAELALEVLGDFQLDFPIYYDWELDPHAGSRSASMDHSVLTDCALTFCSTIEAGGHEAGIYFYRSLGEDTYDLSQLGDYDFWLSHPATRPSFNHSFTIWQYTYEGQVDGISTNVDRDLMYILKSDLVQDE